LFLLGYDFGKITVPNRTFSLCEAYCPDIQSATLSTHFAHPEIVFLHEFALVATERR
jgi:hypothetical protein